MQTIELHLRAKHFENTWFYESDCAIEKAIKDQIDAENVIEYVNAVIIDSIEYNHPTYSLSDFCEDQRLANTANSQDTIIRTLILTPCPKN